MASIKSRSTRVLLPVLLAVLYACLPDVSDSEKFSGTSIGTGNPGKIKIGFKSYGRTTTFAGKIELFGSTHIPLPGFNPEPLAQFQVMEATEFTIESSQLLAISDSAWPLFSKSGDSLYHFQLVFSGDSTGAILTGLAYNIKSDEFLSPESDSPKFLQNVDQAVAFLTPLKPLKVIIDPATLDPVRINYLIVQGTRYFAQPDSGIFYFPSLPEQNYSLKFISLPIKGRGIAWDEDSAYTYTTHPLVSQERTDTLIVRSISERYPMPEMYDD